MSRIIVLLIFSSVSFISSANVSLKPHKKCEGDPDRCEVYCFQQEWAPGPVFSPNVSNVVPVTWNSSNVSTFQPIHVSTSTTTLIPSQNKTRSGGKKHDHNTKIGHYKKIQISKRLHHKLVKAYRKNFHHHQQSMFKLRMFPPNCHVVCTHRVTLGPGPVVIPNEGPIEGPPTATEGPEEGNDGDDDEDENDDVYVEGEDKPVEVTIHPHQYINGIRPAASNIDFIGLSDFGPDGNVARNPEILLEEEKKTRRNHRKRKN